MATSYPGSLDNFTNPTSTSPINSPSHADQHSNANDAIEALEAKVGSNNSVVTTSHDYKIAQLESLVTSAVAGAKSIYQDVRNQSGSAFTKATPVYVSGSTGASGQLLVSAASNATEATSSKTMGITTSAISNNSNGQVISEGILEGIDTTGAADGDPVWLGVNGAKIYGLINKPSSPAHLVFLGIVIRGGQATTGSMYVKIQNGFELQEIHNVELSSLVNGNILAYDSTTQTWKNTNTLQSTSSTTPLVVKGTSSPSANIFEVQNSSGYPMVFVDAYGALKAQASGMYVNSGYASGTGLVVRGYTSQTADLQQWQNSSGTVNARIDAYGTFQNGTASGYGAWINVQPAQASDKGIIIRSAASQTANLQEWQNSSGGVDTAVTSTGRLSVRTTLANAGLNVGTPSASTIGQIIRGAASQTANLQQWQDSAGSLVAWMGFDGRTYLAYSMIGTWNLDAMQTIYSNSASRSGSIIRGAASQTANLQEWQDSSGNVLANVTSSGRLRVTAEVIGTGSYLALGANGGNAEVVYLGYNYDLSGTGGIVFNRVVKTPGAANQGLIIKGAASQTADLQQWQDSAGAVKALVGSGGNAVFNGIRSGSGSTTAAINAYTAAAQIGILVKGAASQTADLQQWQDSAGSVLSSITYFGGARLYDLGIKGGPEGIGWAYFGNDNTSTKNVVVRAFASQTANLTEWQNSAGTVLASINASGNLILGTQYISNSGASAYGRLQLLDGGTNQTILYPASAGLLIANAGVTTMTVVKIRGAASQTANLQEWQDSAGTVMGRVDGQYGTIRSISGLDLTNTYTGSPTITARVNYPNTTPIIIVGAASQTADLQQWQNSAGEVQVSIKPTSNLTNVLKFTEQYSFAINWGNQPILSTFTGNLVASPYDAERVALIAKGLASQTANLQEWQNSSGTVLTGVSPIGQSFFQNTTPITASAVSQAITAVSFTSTTATYTFSATVQTISVGEYVTVFGITPSGYNGTYKVTAVATVSAGSSYSFTVANTTNATVTVGTGYFFPSASVSISTQNKAHTGLIVKAVSGQTASTMEIQNSLGQPVTWWDSTGGMTASQAVVSTLYSGGFINTGTLGYFNATTFSPSVRPIVVRGAASQTANLTEWQNSAGTVIARVQSDGAFVSDYVTSGIYLTSLGKLRTGSASNYGAQLEVTSTINTNIGAVVRGASSQTANLTEWQNSTGSVLASVSANGTINTSLLKVQNVIDSSGGGPTVQFGNSSINIWTFNATSIPLIINAYAGQTNDITQWKNSSGTVVTAITSDGSIKGGNSNTISVNTATTVDTVALSSFTTIEYTLSIKQGSKIRSSKVLVHTDGTSIDSTEYGIMEMGGGITGILVTASVSSTNSILQVTITDAATTNATVKLIKTML